MNIAVITSDPVLVAFLERPLMPLGHQLTAVDHVDQLGAIGGQRGAGAADGAGGSDAVGAASTGSVNSAVTVGARPDAVLIPRRVPRVACAPHPARLDAVVARVRDRLGGDVAVVVLGPDNSAGAAGDRALAREVGADGFLPVPFSDTEVLDVLGVLVGSASAGDSDSADGAGRRRHCILLVDDSALIHGHTSPILRQAGYEVISARDGAQALERFEERRPDLVITDVEMPGMDGYALCRAVKQAAPHLPVLICSTLGEAADLERGFDAGADDYLVKPAVAEELLTRLRALVPVPGRRERILVVDDSPSQRHYVADCLTRQGFEVITAKNGREGLERALESSPALLISDYEMPEMTGFELVHALKRDPATRNIPVIMLTARDSRRDMAQMRAVGATAYLVKPFAQDKCIATVERTLAERRLMAYKEASRFYISDGARRAAEQRAGQGDAGGVRAQEHEMAVLFSDLQGFTRLSGDMQPRAVIELLNAYFDRMCPIIIAEGGDIDKFIGDAIMAVFGATDTDGGEADSAALRATRAALAMQAALREFNRDLVHPLTMRIGINTGPVVRGDLGSRFVRLDYTVVGDAVNRAQRYEGVCPPGQVLVSASTRAHLGERAEVTPIDVSLKGVDEAITAYVVAGLGSGQRGQSL